MKQLLTRLFAVAALLLPYAQAQASTHPAFEVSVSGEGQPVILIPGLASAGAVWDDTVARYCGQRQCHVLTLAGFAGVPAISAPLLPNAEQQLSDYIATNHLAQPVVIGHSLGGYLALKLASDHPQQVGKLIIVDALPALGATRAPGATPAQLKEMADQVRARMLEQDAASYAAGQRATLATMITRPADVDRVAAWGLASDHSTVANAMADLLQDDLRQDIARIQVPTLVLGTWIAYQQYAPRAAIEQMYRQQYSALPGVQLVMADKARHFIMVDDPDWMYARIDAFLKK